jgi:hypothetical protein
MNTTETSIVRTEPLKIQRLTQRDEIDAQQRTREPRDARARQLRDNVKDFAASSFALMGKVRQDFMDKGDDEKILDCATWSEYCEKALGYSESHVRNMIAKHGVNPASKFAAKKPHIRKKSNRQIVEEGRDRQHIIEVKQARDQGFQEGKKSAAAVVVHKGPVVPEVAAKDAQNLDEAVRILLTFVWTTDEKAMKAVRKEAITFLKSIGQFKQP